MSAKLLTLQKWASTVYGDNPPSLETLRRWVRGSRIYPAPEKHGRAYYVREDARYIDPSKPVRAPLPALGAKRPRLADRI